MMTNHPAHYKLAKLYQEFDIKFNEYNTIAISTKEQLDLINSVKNIPGANFEIQRDLTLAVNQEINAYVTRPNKSTGLFVTTNLEKLSKTYPISPPSNYYLIETKEANFFHKSPDMETYEKISIFLQKILGDSVIFNSTTNKLTVIGLKIRQTIPCYYSISKYNVKQLQ
ncbi:hypothetical protein ACLSZC_10390, partial [Avibacterium avium]|uniref:hypothetical protein n=1 Tax=Avibacterium avium TaxID=751 RepID=UPI003BF8E436